MNRADKHRVVTLVRQIEHLLDLARATTAAQHRKALLEEAERLEQEAQAILDRPCTHWLGMSRTGWLCLQWGVGLVNGLFFWINLDDGRPLVAAISLAALLMTAR